MQKIWCCLLFVSMAFGLRAQLQFGVVSSHNVLPALNYAIDYYNTSRPWLDNGLGQHSLLNGFEIALAMRSDNERILFRPVAISRQWQKSTAKGTTPGGEVFTRKVRTRLTRIILAEGTYLPLNLGIARIGGGLSGFDLTFCGVKTKYNDEKWTDNVPKVEKRFLGFIPEIYGGNTLHVAVVIPLGDKGPLLEGQLYYYYQWIGEEQIIWINEALNPGYASNFPVRQSQNLRHAGLKIRITL